MAVPPPPFPGLQSSTLTRKNRCKKTKSKNYWLDLIKLNKTKTGWVIIRLSKYLQSAVTCKLSNKEFTSSILENILTSQSNCQQCARVKARESKSCHTSLTSFLHLSLSVCNLPFKSFQLYTHRLARRK